MQVRSKFQQFVLPVVSLIILAGSVRAQQRIDYEISFPNAVHHEAEITVTFKGIPRRTLAVRMSRSSPGRYATHDFARNVYNVLAFDGKGTPLSYTRPNGHQWNISGHNGIVKITYTLFADLATGTYSGIDGTMAHLNIPSVFMWARGMETAPVRVHFHRPAENWKIATQLAPTKDPEVFTAPNLQYFMDSPTMLADFRWREWPVQSGRHTYTFRLAVNDNCPDEDVDQFTAMLKKIVAEQIAVFGEAPPFDYGTYTFIANYMPQVGGDGMEHRNSTSLTGSRSLCGQPRARLGTASHEFFHAWNVERLRPRSLEPFDFEDANISGELWLAEGFTSYYGNLILRRAGFSSDQEFARGTGFAISTVINSPARQLRSPVEMSQMAVFADGGVAADPNNYANNWISYYTVGNALAIGLDLLLRTRYPGRSLDDYMRELWQSFGKHEKTYTLTDLQHSLEKITGDPEFAAEFFARYVHGHEVIDYEGLLAQVGFQLRKSRPGKVWLEARLIEQNGSVVIGSATIRQGPLYQAGLDRGDKITAVEGEKITRLTEFQKLLEQHKPGDRVEIQFEQRGKSKTTTLTFTEDPQLEVVPFELAGKELSEELTRLRESWLGSRSNDN